MAFSFDVGGELMDLNTTLDGYLAAVLTTSGCVSVYDLIHGSEVASFCDYSRRITCIALTSRHSLVCGTETGSIVFWTLSTTFEAKQGSSLSLHAVSSLDKSKPDGGMKAEVKNSQVNRLALSPNGRWLLSAGQDSTLKVVSISQKAQHFNLVGHRRSVADAAVSRDSIYGCSASFDRTLRIWCLETGRCVQQLLGHHQAVLACSWGGKTHDAVASASTDGTVRLWEPMSGVVLAVFRGHHGPVLSVALGVDGPQVLSAGDDSTLRVWRADEMPYQIVQFGRQHDMDNERFEAGHFGAVRRCILTPDCLRSISVGSDGCLKVFRLACGHQDTINDVTISHDGEKAVTCSPDKTVRVWDTVSGTQLLVLATHSEDVIRLALSPMNKEVVDGEHRSGESSSNGVVIATASGDCSSHILDCRRGVILRALGGKPRDGFPNKGSSENLVASHRLGLTFSLIFSHRWCSLF